VCPPFSGANGIEKIIELKLNAEEQAALQKSAVSVGKTIAEMKAMKGLA